MEQSEFDELVADIRLHGLTEEIWTLPDNVTILDGRHRYKACLQAGVKPRFRVWDGAGYQTPREFVISENLRRRHLTPSQRAAFAAVDILPTLKKRAKARMSAGGGDKKSGTEKVPNPIADIGEARSKAAELAKVNEHYISDAEQIARQDPELIKDVQSGKVTITAAKKKLATKKKPCRKSAPSKAAKSTAPEFKRSAKWLHKLSDETRLGAAKAALEFIRPRQGKCDGTYSRTAISLIFDVSETSIL